MLGNILYFAHRHARLIIVAAGVGFALSLVAGGEALAHHLIWR
ncbi:hypothetical protein [Brevundimonas sp.]|nr:hypothetical protein [Brevundimonas sp.]